MKQQFMINTLSYDMKCSIQDGYFSITGTEYCVTKKHKRYKNGKYTKMGAIADTFSMIHPTYKDICDMHLRNIDGSPMYAFENGMWFLGYTKDGSKHNMVYGVETVARHFMIENDEAIKLIKELANSTCEERTEIVKKLVEQQKPIWKEQADKILNKYFAD